MTITSSSTPADTLALLTTSRYVLLRSFRRDGTGVDTPLWFVLDGTTLVFRSKPGPKVRRLTANPRVELRPCDFRGRPAEVSPLVGRAAVLDGESAEAANRALHRRYGWQWNVVPLIKIPGVTDGLPGLSLRERFRHARATTLWPDSVIVAVELEQPV